MNTKIILPLFLASIMIFSILGFALTGSDNSERIDFNGYKFSQTNQGFLTYKNNQQIIISSDPRDLDLTKVPDISLQQLNSAGKIYFTSNPEENLQYSLTYFNSNIRPKLKNFIFACTEDVEQCAELPLKTCENTTVSSKIIQINLANESSITYNNNCLHIQGSKQEVQNIVDALILKLLL